MLPRSHRKPTILTEQVRLVNIQFELATKLSPKMSIQNLTTTTNFVINYDSTNILAKGMAQALSSGNTAENEFTALAAWFNITVGSGFGPSDRITVTVQAIGSGGANNGGYSSGGSTFININLLNPSTPATLANSITPMLFVNELVEVFMTFRSPDRSSWDPGSSDGEGLSQFCGIQRFPAAHYQAYPSFASSWLTSGLGRQDWINNNNNTDGDFASFGCALLFLNYLNTQLGFSPPQIIQAGGSTLAQTYQNLTGDPSNPFGFFLLLVGSVFPVEQPIPAGLSKQQTDDPFPLFIFQFGANKNSFSKAEVQHSLSTNKGFPDSQRLVLEGCSPFTYSSFGSPLPVQPDLAAPSSFNGIQFNREPQIQFQNAALQRAPQLIEFVYDSSFDAGSLNAFTPLPQNDELDSSIVIAGQTVIAKTELTFYGAEDPYFVTFAPGADNVPWLSDDLRVFSAVPQTQPVPGGPSFLNNSIAGAYDYITNLLPYLSNTFGNPAGKDPFDPGNNIIPGQTDALTGDSSVIPSTSFINQPNGSTVYNFAVARVRLNGFMGTQTNGSVRVFFRLWSTQTPDTTYNEDTSYNSHKSSALRLPEWPLPAPDNNTFPFFATSNTPDFSATDNPEFGTKGANSQAIKIQNFDGQWAYFGCFLNVYDVNNLIQSTSVTQLLPGTHHCLVAQIAYDDAPIQTVPGAVVAPGHTDKLAQRNLSITTAYNPGLWPTNRVPQTFDIRPTDPSTLIDGLTFDELMIDWGKVPLGSVASIFWPSSSAAQVISLAEARYAYHDLKAADFNTIEMPVIRGLTFVPIPPSKGPNLAGLLTIELPPVAKGNTYNVIVRRVTSKTVPSPPEVPKIARVPPRQGNSRTTAPPEPNVQSSRPFHSPPLVLDPNGAGPPGTLNQKQLGVQSYRVVTGAFQMKVLVKADDEVLPFDEETLSIMKWRLSVMQPSSRWFPVIQRYIGYLSLRVDGHGGNASAVPPSVSGLSCPPQNPYDHDGDGGHGHSGGESDSSSDSDHENHHRHRRYQPAGEYPCSSREHSHS